MWYGWLFTDQIQYFEPLNNFPFFKSKDFGHAHIDDTKCNGMNRWDKRRKSIINAVLKQTACE